MARVAESERPGVQVDGEMHRRGETLRPCLAEQIVVDRLEQPLRLDLPEQPADRPGAQQRPGAGRAALSGEIDQRHLQVAPVRRQRGDRQVAGELVAVGRADRRLGVPTGGQLGHLPERQQPVAQVHEHVLAAVALHAEPFPGAGAQDHERHRYRQSEDGDGLQRRPAPDHDRGVAQARGIREADEQEPARGEEEPGQDDERRVERPGHIGRPPAHEAQQQPAEHHQTGGTDRLAGPAQPPGPCRPRLGEHGQIPAGAGARRRVQHDVEGLSTPAWPRRARSR